jgi:drug/metabolite transporter (DMT)-like permease
MLKKEALERVSDPLFGAMVGSGAAFVAWLVVGVTLRPVREAMRFGQGYQWFIGSGVLAAIALVAAFLAFEKGDVSVVSPIVSSQPLGVFLLSALFSQGLERVTRRTVLAGTIIVTGTVLLSL